MEIRVNKAGEVRVDKVKVVIKVGPRRLAQIKARAQDKVMAADAAAVVAIRISDSVKRVCGVEQFSPRSGRFGSRLRRVYGELPASIWCRGRP